MVLEHGVDASGLPGSISIALFALLPVPKRERMFRTHAANMLEMLLQN